MVERDNLRRRYGARAERLAENFLRAQGLRVIARNFRCRAGELDLVCIDATDLVVVEVRQRSRGDYGGPLASVGAAKRGRILRTTEYFRLGARRWRDYPVRFDVVAVEGSPGAGEALSWIKDAFRIE